MPLKVATSYPSKKRSNKLNGLVNLPVHMTRYRKQTKSPQTVYIRHSIKSVNQITKRK